ncbi:hypothetical protein CYMTET_52359, partial [Cymbomonas tetramitiformis]
TSSYARTEEGASRNETDQGSIGVWDSLEAIFADIDAQGGSAVQTQALQEPLARLRHLLQLHRNLSTHEQELHNVHIGLLLESSWHLQSLRRLEALVVSDVHTDSETSLGQTAAVESLALRITSILCEEGAGFKLAATMPQTISKASGSPAAPSV